MADITRIDEGGEGLRDADGNRLREGREIRKFTYEDIGAGGVEDVLIPAGGPKDDFGLYIPSPNCTYLICSLKNNDRAITWAKPPTWKGTNDPSIRMPAPEDGHPLLIGNGHTVDQAFASSMVAGEEQGCVIDCSKIPRGIFLVISPTVENFNVSLLIRPHNKQ